MKLYHLCFLGMLLEMISQGAAFADSQVGLNSNSSISTLIQYDIKELMNITITSATLTKTSQKLSPGNTYVITSDEIDKMGVDSIADAVDKMVPGMSLSLNPNVNEIIGVRGMSIDSNLKTQLLQDNLDIGDHAGFNFTGADIANPFLGDVDRLEITLGPGALQLGSGAISGYINKITSTGASKPGFRVHQIVGSGNARLTEMSYGKVQNDNFNYFIYGGYYKNEGVGVHLNMTANDMVLHSGAPFPPSDTYIGHVKYGATDDDYRLSSRVIMNNPDRGDFLSFDIKAFYSDTSAATSQIDIPLIAANNSGYPTSGQWSDEVYATLVDSANLSGWHASPFRFFRSQILSISPETIITLNSTNRINVVPFFQRMASYSYLAGWFKEEASGLGFDTSQARDDSYGFQNRYGIKSIYNNTNFDQHNISFGTEFKRSQFFANRTFEGTNDSMSTVFPYLSSNQERNEYSVFAEDIITFGKLSIIPGFRYDILRIGPITSFGNAYDPNYVMPSQRAQHLTSRLASAYQLTENDIIKAGYSEGYRFPDSSILQFAANGYQPGNPTISPEISRNYELTYEKFFPNPKIKMDITQFYNINKSAQGWINASPNGYFGNATKGIKSIGQEYMIKYLPSKNMEAFFAYAWSKPIASYESDVAVANHNGTWSRYPEHMFKMGGAWTIGKITVGSLLKLQSGTFIVNQVSAHPVDDPFIEKLYRGWTMQGDIKIKYAINKNWDIAVIAKDIVVSHYNQNNIFQQGQNPTLGLRPENPRVYLSVNCKF